MDEITMSLIALRQDIEEGTGRDVHSIRTTVAAVLDDVCHALGLSERQTQRVIGKGYDYLNNDPVDMMIHYNRVLPDDLLLKELYPESDWVTVGSYDEASIHPPSAWMYEVAERGATHLIRRNNCTWVAVRPRGYGGSDG